MKAQGSQATDEGLVPLELVRGLMLRSSSTGMSAPEILVGTIPEDVRQSLRLPPAAKIHGSFVYPNGTTVVASTALGLEETKELVKRQMTAVGWSLPEGFERADAARTPPGVSHLPFCKESGAVAFALLASRAERGTLVRIHHASDLRGAPCGPRVGESEDRGDRLGLDNLVPPPRSSEAPYRCLGSGQSGRSLGAYSTELTRADLLRHYEEQLEAAGWVPAGRNGAAESWATAWTFYRGRDEVANALLVLTQYPQHPDCWSIDLSVARVVDEPDRR